MGGLEVAVHKLELHHAVPCCLLRLHDRALSHPNFDGEGIELWLEFEHEAMRYGVDADLSREDLEVLIEASTVLLPREEHRNGHESDFARWGSKGGRETLRRYGKDWFSLLALRRWRLITSEDLDAARTLR
jgi:hypothetical protein